MTWNYWEPALGTTSNSSLGRLPREQLECIGFGGGVAGSDVGKYSTQKSVGHIVFYLQDNVSKHLLVSGDFSSDFPNRNSYFALATLWECADVVLPQTNVSACRVRTKQRRHYNTTEQLIITQEENDQTLVMHNHSKWNKKNPNTIGIHDFSSEPQTKHSIHMTCIGKTRTGEKMAMTVEQGHDKLF